MLKSCATKTATSAHKTTFAKVNALNISALLGHFCNSGKIIADIEQIVVSLLFSAFKRIKLQ